MWVFDHVAEQSLLGTHAITLLLLDQAHGQCILDSLHVEMHTFEQV